ncbi:bacteriohemerythrin [Methylomonas sp. BW4-1]|uniref:Bacteriohemerythrin n=2 Tax=Methylomonas TaxID=416 RepID=A0ABU4UI72_9GAMM|nr:MULTISPECIES: bacteriohemerythrin [Methylomonas]MBD9363221.1 hemerythrin family protein [Methylomonas fluvii]MDX8129181.1 bacteriohemerythrin [Methylomonas sp. OY6]NOV29968.1 bacteriohemerythrin [Methylomonas sp. ZR1]PKD41504.1 bacteriohemerythrin [Methylomonas sp. Kb3]QBC27206.1 bacteriohemerythrin [Methylomonas sp. LW13]
MALITWTAAQYGTNVGFADQEHQTLFGLLNKLYDEATGGAARATVGASLDALIAYVVDHFAHEEKEMVAKGFAGYDRHKAEHEALIGICADLQKKFHAGEAEVTEDVGQLVKSWLDSHIPKFDMAYSEALK